MTGRLPPPLVALSPGDLTRELEVERFAVDAARAVAAGLRGVLLREPSLHDRGFLALAQRLAPVLHERDGWLALHDRPHLVAASASDAVHLGFRSLTPALARGVLGDGPAIGFSSHAGDGPEQWAGADYLFFGPVFDTPSKRGLVEPVGLDMLESRCREVELPVWGIGGLVPEHVGRARAAGAGVAVLSGIFGADDSARAAAAYLGALHG